MIQRRKTGLLFIFESLFALFLVFLPANLLADAEDWILQASQGKLRFYLDYSAFKRLSDEGKTYVELYLTLSRDQLTFAEKEGRYEAIFDIEMWVENSSAERVADQKWWNVSWVDSLIKANQKISIFDVAWLMLAPGQYTVKTIITDRHSGRTGKIEKELDVPAFEGDELMLSQIEFATKIAAATAKDKFVKGNILVIPNPIRLYGLRTLLYFYAEAYNFTVPDDQTTTFTVQYSLIDSAGNVVKKSKPRIHTKPGRTAAITEQSSVATLSTGRFVLRLQVTDDITGQTAFTERKFQVQLPPQIATKPVEDIPSFTEELARKQRNRISYIATKRELDLYDQLSLEGKREFWRQFWKDRDSVPQTPENEFKREYDRRFEIANANFKSFGEKEGWQTDMGRVFIVYGPPDEIERHPADINSKPWQRWIYYNLKGKGQREFVFGDLLGFGTYTLLHSSMEGEIWDENWDNLIKYGVKH